MVSWEQLTFLRVSSAVARESIVLSRFRVFPRNMWLLKSSNEVSIDSRVSHFRSRKLFPSGGHSRVLFYINVNKGELNTLRLSILKRALSRPHIYPNFFSDGLSPKNIQQ